MNKEKRPVLGIPGYSGKDSNNFGVGNNYMEFASKFGNVRIIMPWEEKVEVDLLLLPGGLDVNPARYGQVPGYNTTAQDVFKEFFFSERLKNYVGDTAIFGICLGMQQLNVFFGGSLVQDLVFHAQSGSRWADAHKVYSKLNDAGKIITHKNKEDIGMSVNSHHHQAVTVNTLSEELVPLLYAHNSDDFFSGDGHIVEAFRHKSLPIFGVQYHAEELYDPFSIGTIQGLLKMFPEDEAEAAAG